MADKEELELIKGLLPMVGFCTAVVVAIAVLGRVFTERRVYAQDGQYLVSVRYPGQLNDIREFVQPHNPDVVTLYSEIGPDAQALYDWVARNISYRLDMGEFFLFPSETLRGYGDCLPLDTKIICISDGEYKIRYLGDLRNGDKVLSYNWEEERFEPKKVTAIMDKGALPIVEVRLRNGCSFRSTLDHHFFRWNVGYTHQKSGNLFFRQRLGQINYTQHNSNYILFARQIPALNQNKRLKEAQLWLEGAYAAEGDTGKGHVRIAGDDPSYKFEMASRLLQLNEPFSMSKRSRHSYINILSSPLKNTLLQMGHNAFEKHFIEDRLSCSERQLERLLDGYSKGDAYLNPVNTLSSSHRVREYATSSDELASQLLFIHLILGRPLHSWYQVNHQGFGHKPIWRLTENTASAFNKEILHSISKVSIKQIRELGLEEVRDITVEGNHNFVLADSFIIASNCEDTSILLTSLLRNFTDAHVALGTLQGLGHAWVTHQEEILETTYTSARPVPDPENYVAFVLFDEREVVELWPGALGEVFTVARDEEAKFSLIAKALEAVA